jgi:dimethylamine corrinoid protein
MEAIRQILREAFAALNFERAERLVDKQIGEGADPFEILEGCREGMEDVGSKFDDGEYYLGELILAAEAFKRAAQVIEPHLAVSAAQGESAGTVVLATPAGDVHDLGKNILATLLRASGFEVCDLGTDVPSDNVLAAVEERAPGFLGLSMLMTTGIGPLKDVLRRLDDRGSRSSMKVMIGGGVTSEWLRTAVGADFQTTSALDGVEFCKDWAGVRS